MPGRVREFNACHDERGRFCGKGTSALRQWASRVVHGPEQPWLRIDRQGRASFGKKKRQPHLKIDRKGRVTFEAASVEQILDEERARVREAWTDAARQASIASRRGRAKQKPERRAVPRGTSDLPTSYVAAQAQKGAARAKAALHARRQGRTLDPEVERANTGTTASIRGHVARGEAARRAVVAGQRADLAKVAADRARDEQAKAGRQKARDAAAKSGASKAASDQKKAIAAEHDAKLKPMASKLMQMAAAGQRSSPQYAAAYKAYQRAKRAKAAALGTGAPEAPEAPKKAKTARSGGQTGGARRVRVGQSRTSKVNAFGKGRTIVRVRR